MVARGENRRQFCLRSPAATRPRAASSRPSVRRPVLVPPISPWHVDPMRAALALALVLAVGRPAIAHMVVLPATSHAGGWERYSLLVPTEKESETVRIELRLPLGMEIVAFEAKPGWEATHDPFPIGAAKLRWSGGRIPAGQMMSFDFMAWNPKTPRTLTWEATQWYADGGSDRWGGRDDPEHHASTTVLAAPSPEDAAQVATAGGEHHHVAPAQPPGAPPAGSAAGEARPAGAPEGARPVPAGSAAVATAEGGVAPAASGGPSFAVALALSSVALSVAALVVAANARRRATGG
jgi:uncharacterized protein YcnI